MNYNDLTATSLGNKGSHPEIALIQVSEPLQFSHAEYADLVGWLGTFFPYIFRGVAQPPMNILMFGVSEDGAEGSPIK